MLEDVIDVIAGISADQQLQTQNAIAIVEGNDKIRGTGEADKRIALWSRLEDVAEGVSIGCYYGSASMFFWLTQFG